MKRQAPLEDADEILKTARAHFTSKNYGKAIGYITTLLKRADTEQHELYNLRACAKLELNDLNGALADARAALKQNRVYTQAYNTTIRILLRQKNTTAAKKLQEKGLGICDKSSRHYATLKDLIYIPAKNTRDPATLPLELFEQILLYLPDKEIRMAQLVNRQWSTLIAGNGAFWRTLKLSPLKTKSDKLLKSRSRLLQQKCRFVRRLDLSIHDFEFSFLFSVLQNDCPLLKDLTLRDLTACLARDGYPLEKEKVAVEMLFRCHSRIEKLALYGVSQRQIMLVGHLCHSMSNLQELQITGSTATLWASMTKELGSEQVMPRTPLTLRKLLIDFSFKYPDDLEMTCTNLVERCPDLETLHLISVSSHRDFMSDLLGRLGVTNTKLRDVFLSNFRVPAFNSDKLEHLTLENCVIIPPRSPDLEEGFPLSPNMKTISMRHVRYSSALDPNRYPRLPFGFESLQSLQFISHDSDIDVGCFSRILTAPGPFVNMEIFEWECPRSSHIDDDGSVKNMVAKFPNLERCKIVQHPGVTGVTVKAIITNCKSLKELTIRDCPQVSIDAVQWARSQNVKVNFSRLDTMSRR